LTGWAYTDPPHHGKEGTLWNSMAMDYSDIFQKVLIFSQVTDEDLADVVWGLTDPGNATVQRRPGII